MIDKGHALTDKEIEKMERHLSAIYSRAEKELSEKADKYFERFRKRDEKMRELLDAGKIDRKEYDTWRKNQLMTGRHWTEMKRQAAHRLTQADQEAADYINGRLPSVYALNYNAVSDGLETQLKGYSFEMVDANTVKNLATQDKTLLPYKYIDGAKAERWHTQRVNAEVLQGILQGESIPKIAKRLRDNVGMSARGSAVRNARTAVTSAENKGRMDMLHDAEEKGVKAEKGWLAAHDARVRESHAQVDGEFVGIDDEFSNGLQFPGDPDGAPEEVYNCRCTLVYKVVGFKSADDETNEQENIIEDNNAYNSQKVYEQIEETPPMNEYEYWSEAEDRKRFNAIKEQTGFDDEKAETTLRAFSGNRADYHGVDDTPEGWFYRADRKIRKLDGEKWSNAAQTIDEYIEAAPKFDGTIYRGMSLSKEKIDAFQQGGIFQDNGSLSSWTSSLDVAQMFAEGRTEEYGLNPVIIETASHPHSTPVAHLSLFGSDENEVLVSNMHGNEYKIDNIEKRDGVLFVRLIFGG